MSFGGIAASIWLGLATAGLLGCADRYGDEDSTHWVSLIDTFPLADVSIPTLRIDFREEAASRHLVRGWATPTGVNGVRPGLWSLGEEAELEFFVAEPRNTKVALRGIPVSSNGSESFSVELSLNGRRWTDLSMRPRLKTYSQQAPGELLRQGRNRLGIRHRQGRSDHPLKPARDLRVLWKFISFQSNPDRSNPEPRASRESSLLLIPPGTRVDYYLAAGAVTSMAFDRVSHRGMPAGSLEVSWTDLQGESWVIVENLLDWPTTSIDLTRLQGAAGRLSFFARSPVDPEDSAKAGVLLFGPRLGFGVGDLTVEASADRPSDSGQTRRPNVLLYVIDTLRADHLGCYGYDRSVSPNIDRFAEESALFLNAQAQSPWTRASVASIFTGLLPHQHTANDEEDALPEEAVTLAEVLHDTGYLTAAVSSNSNASEIFGFAQGFETFERLRRESTDDPPPRSSEVNAAAFQWLDNRPADQPFFLFLHTVDPHAPYRPPEPFRTRFAGDVADLDVGSVRSIQSLSRQREAISPQIVSQILDLYAAEVAANDQSFGELLDYLERQDLVDDTVIVVVSDHGEEFNEHGQWAHGKSLFSEVIDVPMILRLPSSGAGMRIEQIVQHVDILPTILDYLDLEIPPGVTGRSLLPLIEAEGQLDWPARAVAHIQLRGRTATSYIGPDWKVIVPSYEGREGFPMLYDRRSDRRELADLADSSPELARFWASQLRGAIAAAPVEATAEAVSEEDRAELEGDLRALGYIQ